MPHLPRTLQVAALLACMALAGCADDAPATDPSALDLPSAVPHQVAWGLDACTFLIGFVPVDAAVLAANLPEGFTPGPGMVPGAGPMLGVEAFSCSGGIGLDGATVAPLSYGSFFASADPPAELAIEGTSTYWVKWDTLVPDAPRRGVLAAAGLPAREGTTTVDTGLGVGDVEATLELGEVGTFTLRGQVNPVARPSAGDAPFAEFTPTAGGLARWNATVTGMASAMGTGVLTLPAGSLAAELAGGTTLPALLMAGQWSFVDGQTVLKVR